MQAVGGRCDCESRPANDLFLAVRGKRSQRAKARLEEREIAVPAQKATSRKKVFDTASELVFLAPHPAVMRSPETALASTVGQESG